MVRNVTTEDLDSHTKDIKEHIDLKILPVSQKACGTEKRVSRIEAAFITAVPVLLMFILYSIFA